MRKIVVCLAVAFLFGSVSFVGAEFKSNYNNRSGYQQVPYTQPAYTQPTYDNTDEYKNEGNYMTEFIKGNQRQQMVQGIDRSGRTVQAVVPVGTPEDEIEKE